MTAALTGTPVKQEAMYSAGAQKRIMLIHDTTQELPVSALRRVLHVFSLNPGDQLSLFGVFQLDSKLKRLASIDGKNSANRFSVDMDALKKKEYENRWEILQLSKLCETQKVVFSIDIASGPSRNFLAVEAAKKSGATWVILDRKMKKDKNYFLRNLSCGISKLKQHNYIAQIRGPVIINDSVQSRMASQTAVRKEDDDNEDDLFSIEISPVSNKMSIFTFYGTKPTQTVSDAVSKSTSTKQDLNDSRRASLPSSTKASISNNSIEHEYISYTAVAQSHELKREISKLKHQISYNEMIC